MKAHGIRKWTLSFAVVLLIVVVENQNLYAQTALAKLNAYFSSQQKRDPLNGVIVIQQKGKTIFEKAFGYASVEHNVKNSLRTRFPIASITKTFTATSILLLEQRGLLSIGDKIMKYLPEVPESWQDISIKHLLTHTSGIADYAGQPKYDTLKHLETNNNELLQRILQLPLHFKAGESYDYSNSNYVLLACIIERVTKLPVANFISEEICKPLGLKNTFFPGNLIPVQGLATGYIWQEQLFKSDHIHFSNLSGSGGLVSTAGDLSMFINAMMKSRILPRPVVEQMITPIREDYGLGWMNRPYDNSRLIGSSGRFDGYYSQMWYEPKEEVSVVYLSNAYNGTFAVISNVYAILLNSSASLNYKIYEDVPPVVPYHIALDSLDDYTGSYAFRNQILRIKREDDKLYIMTAAETEKSEMIPYSKSRFWVGGPGNITVTFTRDQLNKRIIKAEVTMNGTTTIARKE